MRPAADREQAFAYYAALPVTDRSLRLVAEEFGVSLHRAKEWSKDGGWQERLRMLEEQVRERTNEEILRSREERVHETLVTVDAARRRYREQLRKPGYEVKGHELAALLRVEALLEGEATDRVARPELEAEIAEVIRLALQHMTVEQGRVFLAALRGEPRQLPEGEVVDAEETGEDGGQEGGES